MRLVLGFVALLVAGCGSSAFSGACDTRSSNHECIEYSGPPEAISSFQSSCGTNWHSGGCDHTNSVGGCKISNPAESVTVWYYAPSFTVQGTMQACAGGGSYVSP